MKIFSASNPTEAHIICGLLESENISCEVRGEGLFGLKGEIPFTEETDPYVWLYEPE
ncbi:putative signal transducing protein, partial [Vibrio crassostreae]